MNHSAQERVPEARPVGINSLFTFLLWRRWTNSSHADQTSVPETGQIEIRYALEFVPGRWNEHCAAPIGLSELPIIVHAWFLAVLQ